MAVGSRRHARSRLHRRHQRPARGLRGRVPRAPGVRGALPGRRAARRHRPGRRATACPARASRPASSPTSPSTGRRGARPSYRRWYVEEVFEDAPAIEMEIVFRVQRLAEQPAAGGGPHAPARRQPADRQRAPRAGRADGRDRLRRRSGRARPSTRSRSPTRASTSWPRRRSPTAPASCSTSTSAHLGGWIASMLVRLGDLKLDFLPADDEGPEPLASAPSGTHAPSSHDRSSRPARGQRAHRHHHPQPARGPQRAVERGAAPAAAAAAARPTAATTSTSSSSPAPTRRSAPAST